MNWKTKAAESIVKHEAPAVAAPSNDQELARTLLRNYPNLSERDGTFARSLIDGFTKYGSFTDKQRPHVERLAGLTQAAPSVDAPLAERLAANLENLTSQRDHEFASSLLEGFKRYGSFTPKQRPHVERLIATGANFANRDAAPVSEVKAPPFIAPSLYPNLCKVVSLDAFARFTVGNFRASLKNDGSAIWLKWEDTLFGVIDTSTGAYRALTRGLSTDAHRMAVHALNTIEADPRAAASADGILTGRCSCCSRPLTDPQSIEIGIGPICLAKAGW